MNLNSASTNIPVIETKTYDYLPGGLVWLYNKVSQESSSKRKKNYSSEDSFTDYTLCYTLSTVDDIPYLGSLAWNRPLYNGMVRVASRYCVNPDFAYFNIRYKDCIRVDAIDHINQQVEFTKNLGFNDHFISREDRTVNARNTRRILNKLNECSSCGWKMADTKVKVAPNPVTGWQWIIYNNQLLLKNEDEN